MQNARSQFRSRQLGLVEEKLRQRGMNPSEVLKDFGRLTPSAVTPSRNRNAARLAATRPRKRSPASRRTRKTPAHNQAKPKTCASRFRSWRKNLRRRDARLREILDRASRIFRTPACPSARSEADNVEVRRWGPARQFRFRSQAALGTGRATRHSRSRARRQTHRREVRRLLGSRRETGARARQLHARSAHARARIHRSSAALSGEFRVNVRHRPVAQVRATICSACRTAKRISGSFQPPKFP